MKRTVGLLVAGAVLVGVTLPRTVTTDTMTAYNSGHYSELVTGIPITKDSTYEKHVVYCVDLGTPPTAGEILYANADFEVTNDQTYHVLFATQIILSDSCGNPLGTEITEGSGYNLERVVHHGTASRTGLLVVPADNSRRFVVVVAWSAGWSSTWEPNHALKVEQDYGRLTVLRWQ